MDEQQKPQPARDKPEKKTSGGNLVWYMLGLGVLLLLLLTIFNISSSLTLGFSDLLKLVRASGKGGPGFIEIVDPTSGQPQRISNLSNVVVGSSNVIATVNREFLKASSGSGAEKNRGRAGDNGKSIEIRVDRQPDE